MAEKKRAPRNRTLTLTPEERAEYRQELLVPTGKLSPEALTDRVLNGDLYRVLDFLPDAFVDRMIIDPP